MMTYEMIGVADQNNRTYESKYGTYSKETGFVPSPLSDLLPKVEFFQQIMHENCWSLKEERRRMTKEEIEKALGCKIDIIEYNEMRYLNENNLYDLLMNH